MPELLKSPLYERQVALGARFAEFGGWSMPLQYSGIVAEHRSCRESVAIFDVSHLGKVSVKGPAAVDFLNACLSNDLNRIAAGKAQYTLACNESGGVVDDLIAYRISDDDVFLIPNASNTASVVELLLAAAPSGIEIENLHRAYAVIAVQGRYSDEVLAALGLPVGHDYMSFQLAKFGGTELTVCRTGYTGERGYELVVSSDAAGLVWDEVLAAGSEYDIVPAGLGARDTLRTEMGYPLHGHELTPSISPIEGSVAWAVGWKKDRFWGSAALKAERANGAKRLLRGLSAIGKGIPRPGMNVVSAEGEPLGVVTSGTFSPSLNKGIALALLDAPCPASGKAGVEIRGRVEEFEIVDTPFLAPNVRES
ncbi:MAG: glycine cleavage system aminomethyltransferase GcvT [Propionibacteriaceae bacterium]|jgi:aminomethyltransferase|nr:glycine cleavage system aminomethyltransferase GcvT [Propionibacteriaceae bacterium]